MKNCVYETCLKIVYETFMTGIRANSICKNVVKTFF